jgi:outer membrane protein
MKIFILITAFLCQCSFLTAQEVWSLRRCIDYALENNITVKQSLLNAELSRATMRESKASTLPSLNANAAHAYNFGRTIDPFTNQFATDLIRSDNFSLSSNLNLFSGFQNLNRVSQSRFDYLAAKYDAEKTANDIALNIATAYLQILFSEELLAIAENMASQTRLQVQRTAKLVNAGTLPRGGLLEVEAQLATEELQAVNARNSLDLAYLSLKQALDLPAATPFAIERPNLALPGNDLLNISTDVVYATALQNMPEIKSAQSRLQSSEKGVALARGGTSPRLFMNGSLGTGFSGLRQRVVGMDFTGVQQIGVTQSGEPVLTPVASPVFERIPYNEQINENFNQSFGFFLTIPFFNGYQVRTAVSRAKIARINAEYNLKQTELQLNRNIQQAHADALASFKKYRATEKALESLNESFKYAEQRFNVGVLNAIDYNNAKTRLLNAESDLLQAKYDYIFKLKVLDFYQGKPLYFE